MIQKQNLGSFTSVFCFLSALLFLNPVITAWAVDGGDSPSSGVSARERFYQKYKDRITNTNPDNDSGEVTTPPRNLPDPKNRNDALRKKREERRKAVDQRRKERRKKIKAGVDRLEGKSGDVAKKEKERLDTRRKKMQERKAARLEEQRKKIEERRQAMKEKAMNHRKGMQGNDGIDPGATGYDDGVDDGKKHIDSGRQKPAAVMNRMEELKKRREAMKEKARKHREAMRAKRKSYRDAPDAGMRQIEKPKPHVSGSASPEIVDSDQPDPHISGSTSGGDRPHISGNR